jgi:hypothetical protein
MHALLFSWAGLVSSPSLCPSIFLFSIKSIPAFELGLLLCLCKTHTQGLLHCRIPHGESAWPGAAATVSLFLLRKLSLITCSPVYLPRYPPRPLPLLRRLQLTLLQYMAKSAIVIIRSTPVTVNEGNRHHLRSTASTATESDQCLQTPMAGCIAVQPLMESRTEQSRTRSAKDLTREHVCKKWKRCGSNSPMAR